jgi:hypothetical protein
MVFWQNGQAFDEPFTVKAGGRAFTSGKKV